MGDVRVSQLIAETIVAPVPAVRVSQAIVETIVQPVADVRVSQIVIEVISPSNAVAIGPPAIDGSGTVTGVTVTGSGSVTIGPDAIAGSGTAGGPSVSGSGGVTIGPDAIDGAGVSAGGDARVTQAVAEVFGDGDDSIARVSMAALEAFGGTTPLALISEAVIEVFGLGSDPILDPPGGGAVPPGDDPTPDDSMCGARTPLFYCEIQTPDGVKSYSWTDQPINDPTIQRLPRIVDIATLKREASDWSGAPVINGGTLSLVDYDGSLRALHVAGKLIRAQIDFYLVDDDGRRLGDVGFRVGQAILTQANTSQHVVDLAYEGRFGGVASRVILNKPLPFRRFDAAFNPTLPTKLNGKGQPIPYGVLSDETAGFPTVHVHFTGTRTMPNGEDWYEGYLAGAATWGPIDAWGADGTIDADGKLLQVKLPATLFDTDIAMPNYGALWTSWFGSARYRVYDGMRHTVMYFKPGSTVGEAFKAFAEGKSAGAPSDGSTSWGAVPVHVNMGGVEETGDGIGPLVISSPPRQIQHVVTNFVEQTHNTDADWYPVPLTANATPYAIIDTVSVEAVKDRMAARFGGGYESAFVVGHDLERTTFGTWLQRICLGADIQVAENRHGQMKLGMEDPSAASVKKFTVTNVLKGTYRTWNDDSKRANAITYSTFKNYMLTNESCRLRDSSPPQPSDFLTAPRPFADGTSITRHGGEPIGREEFVYEDWVTRDVTLRIPDDVAGYYLRRRTNGVDMHVLETDLCGLDVDVFDNFDITHDEGMVSTTRKVRCMSVELDPPNPHRQAWMVRLTGYDITEGL